MRPECKTACAPYRLARPARPLAGRAGERLGRGTGSSLEFQDFRDYVPGDDPRHIDWRGYARTDQVQVRLFREEVSPVVEILIDCSRSMAVTPAKETAARDLVDAATVWARAAGGRARVLACAGEAIEGGGAPPFDRQDAGLRPRAGLHPSSLRLLVSDFLFRADAAPQIRALGSGAAHLYVVQLLDPWELAPDASGPHTLIDCEDGHRIDLDLDAGSVARYRERLGRLRAGVQRAVLASGGSYACVAAAPPDVMLREDLLPQGIVEPA